ncbi:MULTISPECIES: hypothetical protein [Streptomyces]|uniref:Lipoprotein n=1 Tax=Streptomyces viridochromogenes TaxID=1938 RepID=A0A0L8KI46_STRVR|nr:MULTISPECIES: hypothetical protein [Streptomyces]KOG25612.1 hypothetical protein ADK34_17245 [Streptomyces viridochromogenes]
MNRRTKAVAALLGSAALLTLTGCGIQDSDVVEAGGAATVAVHPAPGGNRVVLYFLGPDGRLLPSVRDLDGPFSSRGEPWANPDHTSGSGTGVETRSGRVGIDKVLFMLVNGPVAGEVAVGMTTGLPRSETVPHIEGDPSKAVAEGRRHLRLRVPFPVGDLTDAAIQQLVCTTVYAEDPVGMVEVSLLGPDGTLPAARCDA